MEQFIRRFFIANILSITLGEFVAILYPCINLMCYNTGQVEVGLLTGFDSTLKYLNGTCSWRVTIKGAFMDLEVGVSSERTILGADSTDGLVWKCFVENRIELHAVSTVYGSESLFF